MNKLEKLCFVVLFLTFAAFIVTLLMYEINASLVLIIIAAIAFFLREIILSKDK